MASAAVLTADIVNSTLLSVKDQRKLHLKIETILGSHKFEFYRGDSFQAVVKNPEEVLMLVLQIRMAARVIGASYDVRISIGIGTIQSRARKISLSTGEAFTLSGRAFDILSKSDSRLSIQLAADNPGLRVICYFIDYIFQELTPKQAEVLSMLLAGKTQAEVARKLKRSQSTVNKHAKSAGWHELVKLETTYRDIIKSVI